MSFSSRPISLWRLPSLPLQGEDARWQKGVAIFTDSEFLRFRRLFGNVDAARAALNEHEKFARILRYFLGDEGPRLTAFRPPKISGLLAQHSTRRHFPLKLGGRDGRRQANTQASKPRAERLGRRHLARLLALHGPISAKPEPAQRRSRLAIANKNEFGARAANWPSWRRRSRGNIFAVLLSEISIGGSRREFPIKLS